MSHWTCKGCKASTASDYDVCWNCQLKRDGSSDSRIIEKTTAVSGSHYPGTFVTGVGILIFLLGLSRYGSFGSQLIREFGGQDDFGLGLILIGGFLSLLGGWILYNATGLGRTEIVTEFKEKSSLEKAAAIASQSSSASSSAFSTIEQLERLAALKQSGTISDAEFEEQKRKIFASQ